MAKKDQIYSAMLLVREALLNKEDAKLEFQTPEAAINWRKQYYSYRSRDAAWKIFMPCVAKISKSNATVIFFVWEDIPVLKVANEVKDYETNTLAAELGVNLGGKK